MEEYDILYAHDSEDLANKVREKLLIGWQPLGGLVLDCGRDGNGQQFYQTIIRIVPTDAHKAQG